MTDPESPGIYTLSLEHAHSPMPLTPRLPSARLGQSRVSIRNLKQLWPRIAVLVILTTKAIKAVIDNNTHFRWNLFQLLQNNVVVYKAFVFSKIASKLIFY